MCAKKNDKLFYYSNYLCNNIFYNIQHDNFENHKK